MVNEISKHIIRFILLVLGQGLILKNVEAGFMINPFLYILFIMQLPFETPPWMVLLISFVTGFCIDVFYSSMGIHMAACTFVAWVRPSVLRFMAPREGYEFASRPTIQDMGRPWFLTYASIIILIHHFLVFFLEVFSLHGFFLTLLRVIVSGCATLLLVVVTQLLMYRTKEAA